MSGPEYRSITVVRTEIEETKKIILRVIKAKMPKYGMRRIMSRAEKDALHRVIAD